MTLEDIYTREWFEHDFADLQPEFDIVADAIYREFAPRLVVDVGCGPGMILKRLSAIQGVDARGIEGSAHAIQYAAATVFVGRPTPIERVNIVSVGRLDTMFDLVICTEVAEHLDAKDAPHLVKLLCSAMCPIVFTAAPPGQDGHHHVNCQDQNYWINMFHEHGAICDDAATNRLELRWSKLKRLSHMAKNVMVFT